MREPPRQLHVKQALVKRPLVMGVERGPFFAIFLTCGAIALAMTLKAVIGAVALYALLLVSLQSATRSDPMFFEVMRRWARARSSYGPVSLGPAPHGSGRRR